MADDLRAEDIHGDLSSTRLAVVHFERHIAYGRGILRHDQPCGSQFHSDGRLDRKRHSPARSPGAGLNIDIDNRGGTYFCHRHDEIVRNALRRTRQRSHEEAGADETDE